MVKIPDSYGIIVKPSTQTEIAPPDNVNQAKAQLAGQIGQNLINTAVQIQYKNLKEQESFNAAQVIDFKTSLSRFENEKRIALNEMPATDAKAISMAKNQFLEERKTFVNSYLNNYKEDKNLSNLLTRQANAEAVDFEFDIDRTLTSKKREFGQNAIYKSIYDINNRLENGGDFNRLKNELQLTLNTGFQAGLIDQQDIIRETEKQKAIVGELNKRYEKTKYANLIASGQMAVNPNDSEDRKLGDMAFQTTIENAQKQKIDPEVATFNFIDKTGYVPSNVKGIWSTQLNVGSPQQKIQTAVAIADLIDSNPRLQNQFSSEDINYATEIRKRSNAGLPPAQVIEYTDKEISKYQSMDRMAKNNITKDIKFKKNLDKEFDDFASDYKPWFSSNPRIEDAMKLNFETLSKDYFLNNEKATPDTAIEYAKKQLQGEYATTEVGEKKVMRYAPEAYFKKYNQDTSWIKDQFKSKIKEFDAKPDLKNYSIIPTPNFQKTGNPSYFITKKSNNFDKVDIALGANNRPIVFIPNITKTKFYDELKKQHQGLDKKQVRNILEGNGGGK